MRFKRLLLSLLIALPACVSAQTDLLTSRMHEGVATMISWRDANSGVWEKAGWWNSANVLTAMLRYGQTTGDAAIPALASDVLERGRRYKWVDDAGRDRLCEDFNNDFYDDQGWWALAWVEAYRLTGEKKYLDMAETIYATMSTGWTEELGGGIYWKKNPLQYKNAIANNLYSLLAARLYKHTGNEAYRRRFIEASDWMLQSGMINRSNWQVEDGLEKDGTPNSGQYYTYNQGVCIASLAERYELTGETRFLAMAERIADATLRLMTTDEGVLRELRPSTEPSGDGVQFKGIFVRHLAYLYSLDHRADYRDFILRNARSIVERDYDPASRSFGCFWSGPFREVQPAANSCALDCIIEAASLQ